MHARSIAHTDTERCNICFGTMSHANDPLIQCEGGAEALTVLFSQRDSSCVSIVIGHFTCVRDRSGLWHLGTRTVLRRGARGVGLG